MKILARIIYVFMIILCAYGCKKESPGNVVFYTNIQAYLDCGAFDVDVYIGYLKVGSIAGPFLGDTLPDCANSVYAVKLELEPGYYNSKAHSCGSSFCTKKFKIVSDSCTYVFFDHSDFHY